MRQHTKNKCFGKNCFKCQKSHNTFLHLNKNNENVQGGVYDKNENNKSIEAHSALSERGQVLLATTAVVKVYNNSGEPILCCVMLDAGAQSHFIRESLSQTLRLNRKNVEYEITGIGQSKHVITAVITITIKSRITDYQRTVSCLILPRLTNNLPVQVIDPTKIKIPAGIRLADNAYNQPQAIGAEVFFELMDQGKIINANSGPVIQETKLG